MTSPLSPSKGEGFNPQAIQHLSNSTLDGFLGDHEYSLYKMKFCTLRFYYFSLELTAGTANNSDFSVATGGPEISSK